MKRALLSLVVAANAAWADTPSPVEAVHVVSLPLFALSNGGVSVQGERYLSAASWSLTASVGARASTAGDYGSIRFSLGAEARKWLGHRGPLARSLYGALGGAFVWGRVDFTLIRLEQKGLGLKGVTFQLAESLGLGYRFLPFWRLEITPQVGLGLTQVDATKLWVSQARLTAVAAISVGCTF